MLKNANSMANELLNKGFNVYKYESSNRYYVFVGEFNNWSAANKTLKEIKKVVVNAFIKKIDIKLKKEEDKVIENDLEQKTVEKNNFVNETNKEQEKIKQNEKEIENKDYDFYRKQEDYVLKNGYLLDINGNKYEFSFPNGSNKIYNFSNKQRRKIKRNTAYLLVFKNDELIDLLPQIHKKGFSQNLHELGFKKDIYLNPNNNEFQFTIPVSNNIKTKEIVLQLYLTKADFVGNNTELDIFFNDYHLKTIKFNKEQNVYKYQINLNNKKIKITDFLNIKIKGSFSPNNLDNSSNKYHEKAWIKLDNKSQLHFLLKEQPIYNINNFLNMEANKIILLYDKNLTPDIMEKYIKVSTMLNSKYNNKVSNNYLFGDKKAIDLNNINNQERKILISEEFKTTELLDNLTLKLAPKDTEFFLSEYNDIINTNKLKLNRFNVVQNDSFILNSYRKYKNKDYKKGWGNIEYEYFLPGNLFKTNPKEIKLHLTGSYFIPFDNQAYLKVYLNEKIIMVEKLNTSQYFEKKIINIPGKEIESYNDFKIVFSQTPDDNLNIFSNVMETYINPESYITYTGSITRKNNFKNLLLNMSGKGKILITENYKDKLFNTANLFFNYIHKNDYSNLDFTIDYLNNYNFNTEDNNIKWYLIIGADKLTENIKSRVSLVGNNIEFKINENEDDISINLDQPLSYIDLNTLGDKSVIFMNTNSSYDNLSKMMLEINEKEGLNKLDGNILIYNGENYKTFNIANQTLINKTEKYLINLKTLVFKYKLHIYIVSVLLIILFLIWIYYKTSRTKTKKD